MGKGCARKNPMRGGDEKFQVGVVSRFEFFAKGVIRVVKDLLQ